MIYFVRYQGKGVSNITIDEEMAGPIIIARIRLRLSNLVSVSSKKVEVNIYLLLRGDDQNLIKDESAKIGTDE
jgi:hypothetical protein